ncbi:metalloreductase [Coprinopsis cinerea AmutBmut pab1-1]|nr:metalloreductase [Coprinopsis cinerea AmutBmut pab1-1]
MAPRSTSTMSSALSTLVLFFFALSSIVTPVAADGYGVLGVGKWLYKPVCAHACRRIIQTNKLTCDSKLPGDNSTSHVHRRHSHTVLNTKECYLKDAAFLRTLALCIDSGCSRDDVPISVIEEYWEGHVATGSVGDWSLRPIMSYRDALDYARQDVEEVGRENVPFTKAGEPLNVTSFIREEDWVIGYNGQKWFEHIERDHGRNSVAIAISTVCIPILLSMLRFLPGRPLWYSRLVSVLEKPLLGHRHRTPTAGNLGIMPTRGQTLYLVYLLTTQILLAIFPLAFRYPNYIAPTRSLQIIQIVGDRTGVLAMADFVALFLFSSRNNILLWITNWSHSTFLLLHRWIAYCLIFHSCIHSVFMLYLYWPDHASESKLPYWVWGIVATLAFVVMWPASILPVRQRFYEAFLVFHQVFAAIGLIATFYHIYKLFGYAWGYEIWVYIGGCIWFVDRFARLLRMVANGYRTAVVTAIDPSAEYVKLEIDGVVADGHVYLYFPTLNWRVWENHPFSVLSSFTSGASDKSAGGDSEKTSPSSSGSLVAADNTLRPRATILFRAMDGSTKDIADRLLALGPGRSLPLPVIIESSYHANPAMRDLAHCTTLLCIAGGVGITAIVPIVKSFSGPRTRLAWGMRTESLLVAVEPELKTLNERSVEVETSVGRRLDLGRILREEMRLVERHSHSGDHGKEEAAGSSSTSGVEAVGDLGVVVCGPTGMADEVRNLVAELAPQSRRGVVFVDEAFSW